MDRDLLLPATRGLTGFQLRNQASRDFALSDALERRVFERERRQAALRDLREQVAGKRAGDTAIAEIGKLNPESEDYFQSVGSIFQQNPDALADRRVHAFLGIAQQAQALRQREDAYQHQLELQTRREEFIAKRGMEQLKERSDFARQQKLDQFKQSATEGTRPGQEFQIALRQFGPRPTFEQQEYAMGAALHATKDWEDYLSAREKFGELITPDIAKALKGTTPDGTFKFNREAYLDFHNAYAEQLATKKHLEEQEKDLRAKLKFMLDNQQLSMADPSMSPAEQAAARENATGPLVREWKSVMEKLYPGLNSTDPSGTSTKQTSSNGTATKENRPGGSGAAGSRRGTAPRTLRDPELDAEPAYPSAREEPSYSNLEGS